MARFMKPTCRQAKRRKDEQREETKRPALISFTPTHPLNYPNK
jgi:hypothetical protein